MVYTVDRKTAASLLKVSIRTLDRYLKKKDLSSKIVDGRVLLRKDEVLNFGKSPKKTSIKISTTPRKSKANEVSARPDILEMTEKFRFFQNQKNNASEQEDLKAELASSKEKINELNLQIEKYKKQLLQLESNNKKATTSSEDLTLLTDQYETRIKELEKALKTSMPLLIHQKERIESQLTIDNLRELLSQSEVIVKKISLENRIQRLTKNILFALLCVLLALQPLWLLLL